MATETLRIKVVGLREINKVNTAVNKLDKAMKAINRQRVTGTKAAVKVLRQELSIKNKILKADKEILKTRVEQGKANRKNVVTQTGDSGGSGGFGGGGGGKGSGALSSALISGTFPLLFGQGPLAAAGGFAGGFIGDRLGGKMGGFAGGLVGTATVTIIQNAATAIGEVGQAMSPFIQDIDKLVKVTGGSNSVISKQIELIEASKGKQEAFNVAMRIMEQQVGEKGVKALKDFGDTTRLLGSNLDVALTKLGAFTAGIVNFITKITGIQGELEKAETDRIVKAAAATGDVKAQELLARETEIGETGFKTVGGRRKRTVMKAGTADKIKELDNDKKIFAIRQKINIENDSQLSKSKELVAQTKLDLELQKKINEAIKGGMNKELAKTLATLEQTFDEEEKILEAKVLKAQKAFEEAQKNKEDLETIQKTREEFQQMTIDLGEHIDLKEEGIQAAKDLNKETTDIASNFEKIGQSIASGVSDNLTAAIQGTKSLGEAAKSILNDLSSTLIRLGVNTILGGLTGGSSGIFGSLPMLKFSRGGRPPTGRPSLVGEKGPELFVPKRTGTIIPNDKLGGSSTNISVNVDASGSSVQGDEQQSKELGRVISVAIQSELLKQRRPGGLLR